MVRYDNWCLARVAAMLLWLDGWCSISQQTAERGMMVGYLALLFAQDTTMKWWVWVPVDALLLFWVGPLVWSMHRRPAAVRMGFEAPDGLKRARVGLQIAQTIFCSILISADWKDWRSYAYAASQVLFILFYYSTQIGSTGERGRRRKLVWSKIKELFGTEWIPKPVQVPQ